MQIWLSLVAITLLAALAYGLGFRAEPRLDAGRALAEAEAVLPGFRGLDALVAVDGRGALVRGVGDELAVIWPLADGWVARRVSAAAVERIGGVVRVALEEPMRRAVEFAVDGAAAGWLGGERVA